MLTKDDLKQLVQALDGVVEKKIKEIIQEELSYGIAKGNLELKRYINRVVIDAASPLRREIKEIKKDIKSIDSKINKLEKGQKIIISGFDTEYLELHERVSRIERHVKLPKTN